MYQTIPTSYSIVSASKACSLVLFIRSTNDLYILALVRLSSRSFLPPYRQARGLSRETLGANSIISHPSIGSLEIYTRHVFANQYRCFSDTRFTGSHRCRQVVTSNAQEAVSILVGRCAHPRGGDIINEAVADATFLVAAALPSLHAALATSLQASLRLSLRQSLSESFRRSLPALMDVGAWAQGADTFPQLVR